MPLYEYQCQDDQCSHQWEEMQSIKDPPSTNCPKCQKNTAKKLISASSFMLKGSGWAATGYS